MNRGRDRTRPVAAIVLAAGGARRMGEVKQLFSYHGRTLVDNAVQQALETGFHPIIVVVGHQAGAVRAAIAAQPVQIVENDKWETGMGSSVAAGVKQLQEIGADVRGVALLLSDQPLVRASHLTGMTTLLDSGDSPAVAAQYNGIIGVPALFKRELFGALAALPARRGARDLLRNPAIEVTAFPLPEAAMDIDTPQDFAALTAAAETGRQK